MASFNVVTRCGRFSASVNRVPMELWDRILHFACADDEIESNRQLCLNLCRVSPTLRIAATPLLYRDISTEFENGKFDQLLESLTKNPQLALHVRSLTISDHPRVGELDMIFHANPDIMQQKRHQLPIHRDRVSRLYKMTTQMNHLSLYYANKPGQDPAGDARFLSAIAAKVQSDGHLRNLRSFAIFFAGRQNGFKAKTAPMLTHILRIPRLRKFTLDFDYLPFEQPQLHVSSKPLSNVTDVRIETKMSYGYETMGIVTHIVKECKALEHLHVLLESLDQELLCIEGGQLSLQAKNAATDRGEDLSRYRLFFFCLLSHKDTLKSLFIDPRVFDTLGSETSNLFEFKALNRLYLSASRFEWLNNGEARNFDKIRRYMAPNLNEMIITTHVHVKNIFEIVGRVAQSCPASLESLVIFFVCGRVSTNKSTIRHLFCVFSTRLFSLFCYGNLASPLLHISIPLTRKLKHLQSTRDPGKELIEGFPVSDGVRKLVKDTKLVDEFHWFAQKLYALFPDGFPEIEHNELFDQEGDDLALGF